MTLGKAEMHEIARKEIDKSYDALEVRLATAFRKALDTVVVDLEARQEQLEEEHARVLRHLGLEDGDDG